MADNTNTTIIEDDTYDSSGTSSTELILALGLFILVVGVGGMFSP